MRWRAPVAISSWSQTSSIGHRPAVCSGKRNGPQEASWEKEGDDSSIVAFADDADLNVTYTAKARHRAAGRNRITRLCTSAHGAEERFVRVVPIAVLEDRCHSFVLVSCEDAGLSSPARHESERKASSSSRRCASSAASRAVEASSLTRSNYPGVFCC
jgi:hypothetical protein